MNKEQELEEALQKFVKQTEKATSEGWIYSEKFQKLLDEARRKAFPKSSGDTTYEYPSKGVHVIQQ